MSDPSVRCAVLLRGVNVGGNNRVPMAELKALLADLGGANVVTYLQSGQAALDVAPAAVDGLRDKVSAALQERLGVRVDVLVRTGPQLDAVVAGNPYPDLVATPKQLHVVFCEHTPTDAEVERVGGTRYPTSQGIDRFSVAPQAIYLAYAGGSNDSPAAKAVARLKSTGVQTARNWTTVLKLVDLCRN